MNLIPETKQFLADNYPTLWDAFLNEDETTFLTVRRFNDVFKQRKKEHEEKKTIIAMMNILLADINTKFDIEDVVNKYSENNDLFKDAVSGYKHSANLIL